MSKPATGWYCTGRAGQPHDYAVVSPGYTVWPPDVPGVRTGPLPAVLRCPQCGLTKQYGYRVRARLAEAGFVEWDISRPLPWSSLTG
jgi:hypothetical protein